MVKTYYAMCDMYAYGFGGVICYVGYMSIITTVIVTVTDFLPNFGITDPSLTEGGSIALNSR